MAVVLTGHTGTEVTDNNATKRPGRHRVQVHQVGREVKQQKNTESRRHGDDSTGWLAGRLVMSSVYSSS
ncbi:hypothetical protein ABVT39_024660 [Epinephelus coioides]